MEGLTLQTWLKKIMLFNSVKHVARPPIVSQSHRSFWVVPPREQISLSVIDNVFVEDAIKETAFQIIVQVFKLHNRLDNICKRPYF